MRNIRNLTVALVAAATALSTPILAGTCSADKVAGAAECTSSKNIVALASGSEQFKTLVAAVKAAGLVETLSGEGPFTVFAPTDEAFAKLPAGTVENLLKPENRDKLVAVLKYHVVPGKVMAADVKPGQAKTAQGQKVEIKVKEGAVMVDNARVTKADLVANNGVIHVIDAVILPRS
ncbi:MAG: fasciclin domain-containing protein [Verrucomicrobia bacterium]|nr:fasciclin domain-containing protein [Verrucomicrobiota bacterium]